MNPTSDQTVNDTGKVPPPGAAPPAGAVLLESSEPVAAIEPEMDAAPSEALDSQDPQTLVLVLNGLIEVTLDGARMFSLAAGEALDPDYKALFVQHSQERTYFARELQAHVVLLGGTPESQGTLEGALLQAWMNVKTAMAVREDYAVLREVERAEQNARKRYARVLTLDLGGEVKALVERQYSAISRSHDRVRALRQKHALRS
ncbi:PA2169 family four-helix-bundle protein [Pendulispora albinea]|uniref:PA2169 family four-helix-bundle protein n=1 Tax=Pendulispora albinea TaxID=2741071 RepID=A0ABZ2LTX8_9BACT